MPRDSKLPFVDVDRRVPGLLASDVLLAQEERERSHHTQGSVLRQLLRR